MKEGNNREQNIVWDDRDTNPDVWQRLSQITLLCIFGVLLLGAYLIYRPMYDNQKHEAARARALEETRDNYVALLDKRRNELNWLRTDLNYLEKVARDRLGFSKPGEYIIRVTESEVVSK